MTYPRCYMSSTGCGSWIGSGSGYAFWCTAAFTAPRRTADVDGRRRLRSSVSDTLVVALTMTNRSLLGDQWLDRERGMACLPHQSRFVTAVGSSETEDLSLLDEFSVTYTSAGRSSFLDFWRGRGRTSSGEILLQGLRG